eukprot:13709385-Alexandrium_andersonii.AAC.1
MLSRSAAEDSHARRAGVDRARSVRLEPDASCSCRTAWAWACESPGSFPSLQHRRQSRLRTS